MQQETNEGTQTEFNPTQATAAETTQQPTERELRCKPRIDYKKLNTGMNKPTIIMTDNKERKRKKKGKQKQKRGGLKHKKTVQPFITNGETQGGGSESPAEDCEGSTDGYGEEENEEGDIREIRCAPLICNCTCVNQYPFRADDGLMNFYDDQEQIIKFFESETEQVRNKED
jgi:hypothetical protein